MAYSLFVNLQKPCAGREHPPKLHQDTVCHRHQTSYRDQSAANPYHKSSIGLPATSVQPLWNLNRPHLNNAQWKAAAQILKLRALSLTCKGTSKCQVCHPPTATTTHSEGMAPATPHYMLLEIHSKQLPFIRTGTLRNLEDRRLKIQDSGPLFIHHITTPYAFVSLYFYLFVFLYIRTVCVLFRVPCKYLRIMQ